MHDVKKRADSQEDTAGRRAAEERRGTLYQSQQRRYAQADYSLEAFEENTQLLLEVPEAYTMYNYRRKILAHQFASPDATKLPSEWLQEELRVNAAILAKGLKIYAAFVHRHWIFDTLVSQAREEEGLNESHKPVSTTGDEETVVAPTPTRCVLLEAVHKEVRQCEKLLALDERNFHAWNYRRWVMLVAADAEDFMSRTSTDPSNAVVEGVGERLFSTQEIAEAEYTCSKIKVNFSNYSAYHQRSLMVTRALRRRGLWPITCDQATATARIAEGTLAATPAPVWEELRDFLVEDVGLLLHAMYCDPNDQATWFYAPFVIRLFTAYGSYMPSLDEKKLSVQSTNPVVADMLAYAKGNVIDGIVKATVDLIVEEEHLQDTECYLPYFFLFRTLIDNRVRNGQHTPPARSAPQRWRHIGWVLGIFSKAAPSEGDTVSQLEGAETTCLQLLYERLVAADPMRRGMYHALLVR